MKITPKEEGKYEMLLSERDYFEPISFTEIPSSVRSSILGRDDFPKFAYWFLRIAKKDGWFNDPKNLGNVSKNELKEFMKKLNLPKKYWSEFLPLANKNSITDGLVF